MAILIVEDEEPVADFIARGLGRLGFECRHAPDAERALKLLEQGGDVQLLIVDLMLPGMSGIELVAHLRRQKSEIPVLALTARKGLEQRVQGLDAGCDDYLEKPCAFAEVAARVKALLRRATAVRPQVLTHGDLHLDPATRIVTRGDTRIELTNKEYQLLEYLMRYPGRVIPREELLQQVWEYDFETTSNVLEVYVNFVRRKMERGGRERVIHTVRGVGYQFSVPG